MSVTESQKRRNEKQMAVIFGIAVCIACTYVVTYAQAVGGFEKFFNSILAGKIFFSFSISDLFIGIFAGIIVGFFFGFLMWNDNERNHTYNMNESNGTGGFMDEKEKKTYLENYIESDPPVKTLKPDEMFSPNMIMSRDFCRPVNSRKLIGNNNVLVVGGAGTGKSRFLVKPNILQMNSSYVITDPSGELIDSMGKVLSDNGYIIKIFNISDMRYSNTYNPLAYVRDEAGVSTLIECFIENTDKSEGGHGDNQFFVDAEKLLYSACIFYLMDFCTDDRMKNFAGIMTLVNMSSVDESNAKAESPLDLIFKELPETSLAWKYYTAFKQAAGKTLKSIIISCVTRLQPFLTPQVINLTNRDEMELGELGNKKTALFIITPQADRTYSFLASMLYSQMFETLYYVAEQQKANGGSESLNIPVRALMDEFANIGKIPYFPSKLSTMRKYNISATVILQDLSQIEAMYKDEYKTIIGNCSSIIFLGSQEINTLKTFSEMLGKMTIRTKSTGASNGGKSSTSKNFQYTARDVMTPDELGRLPSNKCIVFTQNMRPTLSDKYKLEEHPYFKFTGDASDDNRYAYKKISAFDNSKNSRFASIFTAQDKSNQYKLKNVKDVKVTVNNIDDNGFLSDEDKEKTFAKLQIELSGDVLGQYNMNVPVIYAKDSPSILLARLARHLSDTLKKSPLILFTESKQKGIYIGFCYHPDKEKLKKLETACNKITKSYMKENFICIMLVNKSIDEFKEEINKIYKEN